VHTQLTSPVAEKAQRGMMELLLVNHPARLPDVRQGRRVPAAETRPCPPARAKTRFEGGEADLPQADRAGPRRCCSTASGASSAPGAPGFADQIPRRPADRAARARAAGAGGAWPRGVPFDSYFSGNTVQICPVGALDRCGLPVPGPAVRPGVGAEACASHCAAGLPPAHRLPARHGSPGGWPATTRRSTRNGNCDKGRWAFTYATQPDPADGPAGAGRRRRPDPGLLARGLRGRPPAGWRRRTARAGVLTGGRLTAEDAYAYAKFARVALGTNDIDMRARPHSRPRKRSSSRRTWPAGTSRSATNRPGTGSGGPAGRVRARRRVPPSSS